MGDLESAPEDDAAIGAAVLDHSMGNPESSRILTVLRQARNAGR
jgi:hypothetical protein